MIFQILEFSGTSALAQGKFLKVLDLQKIGVNSSEKQPSAQPNVAEFNFFSINYIWQTKLSFLHLWDDYTVPVVTREDC